MNSSTLTKAGLVGTLAAAVAFALASAPAQADDGFRVVGVPSANPRFGVQNNVLTASATQTSVAWGALPLTNPDVANGVTHYGYNTLDGAPLTQSANEAHKTEPDKNVYLVFGGKHYLYQGHEIGPRGYVTRINLDETDPAKRVTLISDVDPDGKAYPTIDGITWNPFTKQLLLTAESSSPKGGVFGVSLDANGDAVDGKAVRLPALGSGGYEGVQNDKDGNVWLVEDIGGAGANGGKVPNSYLYRFVPTDRTDLTKGGALQALQITRPTGSPATAAELQANPSDEFITQLHTYGTSFATAWITIHTGTDEAFGATAAAKAAGATPLKRPENGVFRPGTDFREFYFTETGDTSAKSTLPGAYGGVFRISQSSASANTGRISIAAPGDEAHTGFDNITFATADDLLVVEDAGDGLHAQRNALDSGYVFHLPERGASGDRAILQGQAPQPVRFLAEGRDASATFDATSGPAYNDGDNEITGIHVSDGDPTVAGLLGAKVPEPMTSTWRTFWTQQHGDNTTWEISWAGRG
ncbi:phosphatase [Intrasporangium oryzae NRRL B-24470]|uniref:Phosphatase n=1 Tax=Intrasporangium oryzae NRRL B-24470 TaxID=1386089 RepID=W9G831_9MICO|nr:alkaline phosphatase PhoX [Intrasporangium oryzae]EWT02195.1 phosphatase [Intrasporangium oryzae NRRL B-24470]